MNSRIQRPDAEADGISRGEEKKERGGRLKQAGAHLWGSPRLARRGVIARRAFGGILKDRGI